MSEVRLTQGLARARALRPNGVAVTDGDVTWTWSEFSDRVARLAAVFCGLGVKPGDRIAMLSLNSYQYLEYYFATLWAGAVIMPLNHRLSQAELIDLCNDGEPCLLIVSEEFAAIGEVLTSKVGSIGSMIACGGDIKGAIDYESALISADPAEEKIRAGDDLACLFYTGGTTGRAKGVMLSHSNIFFNSLNLIPEIQMDESSVHLHIGPLFHVAAGVRLFSTSLAGGAHVMAPKFATPDVFELIERNGVTIATFVPTMLKRLMEDRAFRESCFKSLRYITYGAAPMPVRLLRETMKRIPHVKFVQSYGMTETSPIVSILSARDHQSEHLLSSAGRPALSAEVVIHKENGERATIGEVGEVTVRGPMVTKGYWRNPQATAEAFVNGWFKTGDMGYVDEDGFLFIVDRLKDMILSGGENIYSTEVEQALSSHPSILECAVIGLPDEKWGERVHAVIVLAEGCDFDPEAVTAHCRSMIAGYKIPRSFEVHEGPLPISNVNKVLKSQLRAEALSKISAPS